MPNRPPPTTAIPSHQCSALTNATPSIGTAGTWCSASTIRGLRETTLTSWPSGSSCSVRASIASSPVLPLPKFPITSTRAARGVTAPAFAAAACLRPSSASCWRIRLVRGSVIGSSGCSRRPATELDFGVDSGCGAAVTLLGAAYGVLAIAPYAALPSSASQTHGTPQDGRLRSVGDRPVGAASRVSTTCATSAASRCATAAPPGRASCCAAPRCTGRPPPTSAGSSTSSGCGWCWTCARRGRSTATGRRRWPRRASRPSR